ncbi:MAG TPA: hypothetical protein VGN19_08515 [Pedococcus sp.]|nr:hypothetical protein [Pedococcus sp.]
MAGRPRKLFDAGAAGGAAVSVVDGDASGTAPTLGDDNANGADAVPGDDVAHPGSASKALRVTTEPTARTVLHFRDEVPVRRI